MAVVVAVEAVWAVVALLAPAPSWAVSLPRAWVVWAVAQGPAAFSKAAS